MPTKGTWRRAHIYACSICGYPITIFEVDKPSEGYPECPNCGAEMLDPKVIGAGGALELVKKVAERLKDGTKGE